MAEYLYFNRRHPKKGIDSNIYIKCKQTVFRECSKLYYECAKSFLQMAINLDMIRIMEAYLFFLKLEILGKKVGIYH